MNDIPEFRGWHPELKGYYYFDLYTVYCAGKHFGIEECLSAPMTCFNINHRPFDKFSGLWDICGKRIYQNDILRDKYGNIGLCKFEGTEFIFIDTSGCIESGEDWEVIGNYKENPELLQK